MRLNKDSVGVELSCGEGVAELVSDIIVSFSHGLSFILFPLIGNDTSLITFETNGLAKGSKCEGPLKPVISDKFVRYIRTKPFVETW